MAFDVAVSLKPLTENAEKTENPNNCLYRSFGATFTKRRK